MNKQLIGLALVSLSIFALSGCSSSDDDANDIGSVIGADTDSGADADAGNGADTDTGVGTGSGADADSSADSGAGAGDTSSDSGGDGDNSGIRTPGGYLPGTLAALVEENGGLSALQVLNTRDLDQSINDPNLSWTWFIPTDAAIAAFGGVMDGQNHIIVGTAFDAAALTELGFSNMSVTVNSAIALEVGTEPLTIGGHTVVTPDLTATGSGSVVHMIDGVIEN